MNDSTRDHDQIMAAAGTSLQVNRDGGRRVPPNWQGSKRLKRGFWKKKLARIALALGAVWIGASVIGLIINGLGFGGIMATAIATLAALYVFSKYPKMKVPKRADIMRGDDVKSLVGRTELWLEHQRNYLPDSAVTIVDKIGVQLDALGAQLEGFDQGHPQAIEIRKLVGEHLPEMIESYRKIPGHLRREKRAGGESPDEQLVENLGKISNEIDSITRQLAEGSLDDLAIKGRYLDYKYGAGPEGDSGVPLPDFDLDTAKTKA